MYLSYLGLTAKRSNYHLGLGMTVMRTARMSLQLFNIGLLKRITSSWIRSSWVRKILSLPFRCIPKSLTSLDYLVTNFVFLATGVTNFGTKELRSFPVFSQRGGMSRVGCLWVCPVLALQAHVERISFCL